MNSKHEAGTDTSEDQVARSPSPGDQEKLEQANLLSFIKELDRTIAATADETPDAPYLRTALTRVFQERISEIGEAKNPTVRYVNFSMGPAKVECDGFEIDDDDGTIDIYASILCSQADQPAKVKRSDIEQAAERALRILEAGHRSWHEKIDPSHVESKELLELIHAMSERVRRVRLHILTNGIAHGGDPRIEPPPGVAFQIDIWDTVRLFRAQAGDMPREDLDIDLTELAGAPVPCLPLTGDSDLGVWLVLLPGKLLCRLYERYGTRLLEGNVRYFLQARGQVNRGIRDTLKKEPGKFVAFNNGISMTVQDMTVDQGADGTSVITRVKGLQIVNGGQTTASIHRAGMVDKVDLGKVWVQAKITKVPTGQMEAVVAQISRCANTQNPIQMADFGANDPFHLELHRLSVNTWLPGHRRRWYYERARGQYEVEKQRAGSVTAQQRFEAQIAGRFVKTDAGRWMLAWLERPWLVCMGAQKAFSSFMEDVPRLYGDGFKPNENFYRELVAKGIIMRRAEKLAREIELPAFRAQVAALTTALLSARSHQQLQVDHVWNAQATSPELDTVLRDWLKAVYDHIGTTAAGRNPTEWCKKEECWKMLKASNLALPEPPPPEFLVAGPASTTATASTVILLDRIKRLSPDDWAMVRNWAAADGNATLVERTILRNAWSLAEEGWIRPMQPSMAEKIAVLFDRASNGQVSIKGWSGVS